MTNQAGVRKDLPIEIVFETSAVLRYAYLFETASDGVLCREKVPGSTILYIRNSAKDEILYSRPTETPASEAAAPMDDTSPTQVVAVTQSASASTDLAIIPEEPRPRTATTHLEFPCPKCQNSCRVGQFYCGKCTEPLRDLAHSNVRRTVQMARLRAVNEICARSGMAPSSISVEHIRGSQGSDISQRGLLSLDAESTQTAKKQVKSALKLGFRSVLDRFINDIGLALRSTERGLTQSAMRIQDCIATSQILEGAQSKGRWESAPKAACSTTLGRTPHQRLDSSTCARTLLSFSEISFRLRTTPAWQCLGSGQRTPLASSLTLQYLRHIVDADTAAAERTASKQEEDARRSRQAQPKYSEPYPAKGRGKGEAVALPLALAPRKRRPKEQATHPMARMDAAVPRTG